MLVASTELMLSDKTERPRYARNRSIEDIRVASLHQKPFIQEIMSYQIENGMATENEMQDPNTSSGLQGTIILFKV